MVVRYPILIPVAAAALLAPTVMLMPSAIERPSRPPRSVTPAPETAVGQLDMDAIGMVLDSIDVGPNAAFAQTSGAKVPEAAAAGPPKITGLIAAGGGGGIVLAKTPGGETVQLSRGQEIDGWRLVSIGRSTAIFERSGARAEVRLDLGNRTAEPPRPMLPTVLDTPVMER